MSGGWGPAGAPAALPGPHRGVVEAAPVASVVDFLRYLVAKHWGRSRRGYFAMLRDWLVAAAMVSGLVWGVLRLFRKRSRRRRGLTLSTETPAPGSSLPCSSPASSAASRPPAAPGGSASARGLAPPLTPTPQQSARAAARGSKALADTPIRSPAAPATAPAGGTGNSPPRSISGNSPRPPPVAGTRPPPPAAPPPALPPKSATGADFRPSELHQAPRPYTHTQDFHSVYLKHYYSTSPHVQQAPTHGDGAAAR